MERTGNRTNTIRNAKPSFFKSRRFLLMAAGILLFLPPLSFLPQLFGNTNFCGTFCPRMFFVWNQGTTLASYLDGLARSYLGVTLVVAIIAVTLFFGRHWCSHLCPVGGSMEVVSRLMPDFLKINFSSIPSAPVRYGFLSVYLLAPAFGIGSLSCKYCNFVTVARAAGGMFQQADLAYFFRTAGLINLGLIVALGILARGGRGYCNFLCPVGALDALANQMGLRFGKRMRIDRSRCNGCGACARVCPTWAIEVTDKAAIDPLSCMPCRECEKTCPRGAAGYGKAAPSALPALPEVCSGP